MTQLWMFDRVLERPFCRRMCFRGGLVTNVTVEGGLFLDCVFEDVTFCDVHVTATVLGCTFVNCTFTRTTGLA